MDSGPDPAVSLASRRGLYLATTSRALFGRAVLAQIARGGIGGLVVTDQVGLDANSAAYSGSFINFLRESAGVGIRVSWAGVVTGIEPSALAHLDPPRDAAGITAWPIPREPLLGMRRGPGFVRIEDHRLAPVARFDVQHHREQRLLADEPGVIGADRLSADDESAMTSLASRGLFLRIGPVWVKLPIRFKYARP